MARPIDGDALRAELEELRSPTILTKMGQEMYNSAIDSAIIKIREADTLPMEPKNAEPEPMEWISMAKPEAEAWRECSACGAEVKGIAFPFCPYCGRKARNGVNTHE